MIGDPTEGALVVLAEKGGFDSRATTRSNFPRVAELPFDSEYKLMATFHRMQDESGRDIVRCFVKGAPDQVLARATSVLDADLKPVELNDDAARRGTWPRTSASASRACASSRRHGATSSRSRSTPTPTCSS